MFSDGRAAVSEVQQCIDEHPYATGLVVIFTNDYKDPIPGDSADKLEALEECHTDGSEMKETFCDVFGFACLWKQNCTAAQTIRIMERMTECEYPPSYKCLAVVFSGHGEENVLLGCDGKPISIEEDLIGPLQPNELPEMRDIPKLFFIDACRGKRKMIPAVKVKGPPRGVEKGGHFVAYSTTLGYRSYTYGEKSKWLPKVAQRLRTSRRSVQEIVAEVSKELRMDTDDMQCPTYEGSGGPVYLHELIDNDFLHAEIPQAEIPHAEIPAEIPLAEIPQAEIPAEIPLAEVPILIRHKSKNCFFAAISVLASTGILLAWFMLPPEVPTTEVNPTLPPSHTTSSISSPDPTNNTLSVTPTISSLDELIEVLPPINDTKHFCECLELPPLRCDEILRNHSGDPSKQATSMVEWWWWSFERLQRTWQKIVNALTCNKLYRDAVLLAKKKGGETWYKLMYKSPIPPYMFISVLSMMREVYDGTLPHPRPQT